MRPTHRSERALHTPRLADDPALSLDDSAPARSVTGRPQPTQACMLPLPCPTQLNPSRTRENRIRKAARACASHSGQQALAAAALLYRSVSVLTRMEA